MSKMVKELILDKDEVELPGVGTFVAETVPATFSDKGYTINPPYRKLSFRQRQGGGDDSLINLYIKSNEGVDPEQARKFVTDFLLEMKEVLKQKKNIVFPGLGRLRSTKENNFFFVADEDLDIYPGGFGLEPISLKTHEETPEEVSAVIQQLGKEILAVPSEPQSAEEGDFSAPAAPPVEMTKEVPIDTSAAENPVAESEISEEEVSSEGHGPLNSRPSDDISDAVKTEVKSVAKTEVKSVAKTEVKKEKADRKWIKALLWAVGTIAVLIALYMLAARMFPDFFDSILYTKEELDILNF